MNARLAALMVVLLTSGSASADPPLVSLHLERCGGLRAEDVRARLSVELPGSAAAAHATVTVSAVCGDRDLQLSVDDPMTGKLLSRSVVLPAAAGDVRARIVAIAIAELVVASWLELEATAPPRIAAAIPPPPHAVDDAVRALRREPPHLLGLRLRLSALASTQVFFSTAALWGGGVALIGDPLRYLGWDVDLLAHHGSAAASLGSVSIDSLTVSALVVARRGWSRVGVRAGLGFRLGATILTGHADATSAARGARVVWAAGGPIARVGVHGTPVRGLVLGVALEGGYSIFPTGGRVDGKREIALEGGWLGVQLGVGIEL